MYAIFSKADGVQGFKILYWLSSCDDKAEILKVVNAVNTLVLFFCPCYANFLSVNAHRMCIVHWCLFLAPAVLMFDPNSLGN